MILVYRSRENQINVFLKVTTNIAILYHQTPLIKLQRFEFRFRKTTGKDESGHIDCFRKHLQDQAQTMCHDPFKGIRKP